MGWNRLPVCGLAYSVVVGDFTLGELDQGRGRNGYSWGDEIGVLRGYFLSAWNGRLLGVRIGVDFMGIGRGENQPRDGVLSS